MWHIFVAKIAQCASDLYCPLYSFARLKSFFPPNNFRKKMKKKLYFQWEYQRCRKTPNYAANPELLF
jgi:hypothetical protein